METAQRFTEISPSPFITGTTLSRQGNTQAGSRAGLPHFTGEETEAQPLSGGAGAGAQEVQPQSQRSPQ